MPCEPRRRPKRCLPIVSASEYAASVGMAWCVASKQLGCRDHAVHRRGELHGVVAPEGWTAPAIEMRLLEIQHLEPWILPPALRRARVGVVTDELTSHAPNLTATHAVVPAELPLRVVQPAIGGLAHARVPAGERLLEAEVDGAAIAFPWRLRGTSWRPLRRGSDLGEPDRDRLDRALKAHLAATERTFVPGGLVWVDTKLCRRFWPRVSGRHPLLLIARSADAWTALLGSRHVPASAEAHVVLHPIDGPASGFRFAGKAATYFRLVDRRHIPHWELRLAAIGPAPPVWGRDVERLLAAILGGPA